MASATSRLTFPAVLAASLAAAAVLMLPRLRAGDGELAHPSEPPPPEAAEPEAPAPDAGASNVPPPAYVRVNPESAKACPAHMVLVDGAFCPFVGHRCTKFVDEAKDVCQSHAAEVLCEGSLQHRRYCIDVYEYPNLEGVVPVVLVDFNEARRACAVEGKRLCTSEEWEFACEGTQMWPHPYGIDRDSTACNIDQATERSELDAFSDPWKVSEELEQLDRRAPSGQFPRCVSPFGVRDMTGNVDEWVENVHGGREQKPFRSSLKGGYWGQVRARCRPISDDHPEWFSFYQAGFRCCADVPGEPRRRTGAEPRASKGPRKQRMPAP